MSAKSIFFLGVTGFVGRNLARRLLEQGHRLLCLVRADSEASARVRVKTALSRFFPAGRLEEWEKTHLEIFAGDLTRPRFGLKKRAYGQLLSETEEIWHCAALLSFDGRHRREVEKCNVAGTFQVLEFAKAGRIGRLHYLSTAYVAGRRRGLIPEQALGAPQAFKNPYEQTKWQAERLVQDCQGQIRATIYRPSIIIGGTAPGTICSSGVYRVAQIIAAIAGKYGLTPKSGASKPRLRLPGSRDCSLNLVPIDFVAEALCAIASRKDSQGKVYHLVNPCPTPNPEVVGAVGDAVGIRLELAEDQDFRRQPLTVPEQVLANTIRLYLPYLHDRMVFDETNTREALGRLGIVCPEITRVGLASLLSVSLKQTSATTGGKPRPGPTSRFGPLFSSAMPRRDLNQAPGQEYVQTE